MRVVIAVAVCVVIDGGDESPQPAPCRRPLDDLAEQMRREMHHGRDSVKRREIDGAQVA